MAASVNLRIDLRQLRVVPQILVREDDAGLAAYLILDAPGMRVSFCIARARQAKRMREILEELGARYAVE